MKIVRRGLTLWPSFGQSSTPIEVHQSTLPFLLEALNTTSRIKKSRVWALARGAPAPRRPNARHGINAFHYLNGMVF